MFRFAVSLIGFITTAAMHPAIADPASGASTVTAQYVPESERSVQIPVSEMDAPVGAGWG